MDLISLSFIIPVYNRPNEVRELLQSFVNQSQDVAYEIVIVEDGSHESSEEVVNAFSKELNIAYFKKENTGPGDSRNYGVKKAQGNYFVFLDSDCLLTTDYIAQLSSCLKHNFHHCFGGPDDAHHSFSNIQKAINFSMTAWISTGGIRGNSKRMAKFQPRSFNMGLSKKAFQASKGFGNIHPGEDPDLSIRLNKLGFKTTFYRDVRVYHKRRINWNSFFKQVYKFGLARPILNLWHPNTAKITYWLPTFFVISLPIILSFLFFRSYWPICFLGLYFLLVMIMATVKYKNMIVGLYAIFSVFIQFFGYGLGFIWATLRLKIIRKSPEKIFPDLFYGW